MNHPKIGLVTVLYNTPIVLNDFFLSLSIQDYTNFHLYIVDNSSNSESLELSKILAEKYNIPCSFINNEGNNVGVAAGNNQGARLAIQDQCDYILFINNDLLFESSSLFSNLIEYSLEQNSEVLSPLILNYPAKKIWYAGGEIDELRAIAPHYHIDEEYSPEKIKATEYTYAPTCFLLVTKRVWNLVGEMDEKYFAYYDDTDFIYRIINEKIFINLVKSETIYHKVGSSTGGDISFFGLYHLTRNRIYFIRKNLSIPKKIMALSYTILTRCIKYFSTDKKLRSAISKGIIDGFKL
ncbi:glycosyltransferase family 2 protein [Photobacterium damselae]|uniref:glycosyltransferase family 2 protein n=1 Tax=Photobacterium damselae TaxID=38293 RepID=UPI000D9BCD4A|nr:glycosyltransferase family 2 protein [Photobacterium damselae]NVO72603.1 glycosyltransferase family 2 protein [Photobacterium damselae subsp. damselae]SPY22979.1 putative glycosyl transferase [Photobacterium damselae]